jgi:hypothetical protein
MCLGYVMWCGVCDVNGIKGGALLSFFFVGLGRGFIFGGRLLISVRSMLVVRWRKWGNIAEECACHNWAFRWLVFARLPFARKITEIVFMSLPRTKLSLGFAPEQTSKKAVIFSCCWKSSSYSVTTRSAPSMDPLVLRITTRSLSIT